MAMTEAVKDELGRLSVTRPCCRKAEVSALLRFAGGLHVAAGKIIVEVELARIEILVFYSETNTTQNFSVKNEFCSLRS